MGAGLLHVALAALYLAIGWGVARRLRLPTHGAEGYAYAAAIGTGVASLFFLLLLATGVFDRLPEGPWRLLWPLVLAGLAFPAWGVRDEEPPLGGVPALREPFDGWSLLPLIVGGFLVLSAMATEVAREAIDVHLPAAARLVSDGAGPYRGLLDAEYRLGFDVLWTPLVALDGRVPRGPAVIHAMCSTALAAAAFAEIRRRAGSVAASVGTTLFLLSPGLAGYAVLSFVDHGVALHGFLALASAARAVRGAPGRNVAAAGLLAGFAANERLSGASWGVVVVVALLAGFGVRRGGRAALGAVAAALLVAMPWIVRSWVVLGNPVFPAMVDRFGSGWADRGAVAESLRAALETSPAPRGIGLGFVGTLQCVLDPRLGFEAPGWVIALLPAAWLAPTSPERRAVVFGGVVAWALWAWFVPVVRLGLGAWAWGAVAATVGAARLVRGSRWTGVAFGLLAIAVLLVDAPAVLRRSGPRIGTLVGIVSSDAYAEKALPEAWTEARLAKALPRPVGLTAASCAWVGRDAVSLESARNGVIAPEDYDDSARLLDRLHELDVASLVLRPRGSAPWVDAIWTASDAWAATGKAEVVAAPDADGWRVVHLRLP